MSVDAVLFDQFEIECLVASRDAQARIAAEEAAQAAAAEQALSTLDRALAEQRRLAQRLACLQADVPLVLEAMRQRDWPEFHLVAIIVEQRPLRRKRTEDIVEQRAVRTWMSVGITSRGEFVHRDRLIQPNDSRFRPYSFEDTFYAWANYYGFSLSE